MTYVAADCAEPTSAPVCVFCDKPRQVNDRGNLIVSRGRFNFVILNLYPYNNGHLMVVPYLHTASIQDLPAETTAEMMTMLQYSAAALRLAYNPDGYNVGMNLGRVAGAGIADHLHMHVVPRWNGDTNFMPVIGETKVMPDSLESSYKRIKDAWEAQAH